MGSGRVFDVLKKFASRHKEQRRKTLRENAQGVLKRDHLIAQLQGDQDKSAGIALPETTPPAAIESPETAPAVESPRAAPTVETSAKPVRKPARKPNRAKKPAKKIPVERAASAFEFIAEIDLDLKGAASEPAPEPPPPPEERGLPPDFEAKLKHLRDLMDF